MAFSPYDLKSFYNSKMGRVVRRIILQRLDHMHIGKSGSDQSVLGLGYAIPYLGYFGEGGRRCIAVMPQVKASAVEAHHWSMPHSAEKRGGEYSRAGNLVACAYEYALPLPHSFFDVVVMAHHLEFSKHPEQALQEVWRILKPNGVLHLIVPNRNGMWARAEWSPFGHGQPYSLGQVTDLLKNNQFIHEASEEALFMPPLQSTVVMNSALFFERIGRVCLPFISGVHIVSASKQLYGPVERGTKAPATSILRPAPMPKPV